MSFDIPTDFGGGGGGMPHGFSGGDGGHRHGHHGDVYSNLPQASTNTETGWLYFIWQIIYPICLGFINFGMVIGAWLWFKHPLYAYRILTRFQLYRTGFKLRMIDVDGTMYRIAERGRPDTIRPTLVLLHGFSADLSCWCDVVSKLDTDLDHCIAVDFPGHGNSEVAKDEDFDLTALAAKIRKILEESGSLSKGQPLHMMGQSMGAAIAGVIAADWTERVEFLSLICPATDCGNENEFSKRAKAGDVSWLIPTTPEQMRMMLRKVCYQPVSVPGQLLLGLLEHRLERYEFHVALLQNLRLEHNLKALLDKAPEIKCPSQLIWGRQDEIIPVENAEVLKSKLGNCQRVDLIDEAGHSLNIEAPEMIFKYMTLFRKDQELKKYK